VKRHCIPAWVCAALALLAVGELCNADASPVEVLKNTLRARFPEATIADVRPAPIPGWYEVFTGTQVVYSDAAGDHLFVGQLLDTLTRKDLAADELERRRTIDFQSLPFERAIRIVKGNGAHRLALFEDPDCPYCRALEKQLVNVHDVTLYVFLFPLADLHPQARAHAHAIWCAPDRADAWTHWMLERKDPGSRECSGDPIDALQSVADALYVSSTPTIFLSRGRRIEGVTEAAQLQKLLEMPAPSNAGADGVNKLSSHAAIVTR
jgi:thiol:disulfide interchange protein DsbC